MTKLSCERCSFAAPMCSLHAGADLPRPNRNQQCASRALMRSKRPPKCLLHLPDLAGVQTCKWHQAGIPSITQIEPSLKSP
jgi:hypothetical protein